MNSKITGKPITKKTKDIKYNSLQEWKHMRSQKNKEYYNNNPKSYKNLKKMYEEFKKLKYDLNNGVKYTKKQIINKINDIHKE